MYKYFKTIAGVGSGNYIYYYKFKGLSDERINSIKTSNIVLLQTEIIKVLKQK